MEHHLEQRSGTRTATSMNWGWRSGSLMATATANCLAQRWGSLKARWKAHLTAYSTAQHWEQSWVLRMAISMVRRWDWRSGRPTATSMAQR